MGKVSVMSDSQHRDDDSPSLRQRIHQATGDREREARALADRADDEIDERDAETAVRRASGDQTEPAADDQLATPTDAREVAEERDN
jgi:hypothetical protein